MIINSTKCNDLQNIIKKKCLAKSHKMKQKIKVIIFITNMYDRT